MQVSLAALWKSWGVKPQPSWGTASRDRRGVRRRHFQRRGSARIIVLRALSWILRAWGRTMLAVGLGEEEARSLIARHDRTVTTRPSTAAFR